MMAWDWLTWVYMACATLLIIHEIDSAYWKEWDLFRLPGGIGFFLVLHLPLVFVMLWGLLEVYKRSAAGLVVALVLAAGGIFAFCIHTFFMIKGRPEFKTPVSIALLTVLFVVSIIQAYMCMILLI